MSAVNLDAPAEQVSADIPMAHILLACCVIVLEAVAARVLELGNADQLLISGVRCFVQLSCLGLILAPIFETRHPLLVLGYIFGFMIFVSAYEAAARPKVTYPGMFSRAALSLGSALLVNGVLLLLIVDPEPWYNAQYLIPMAGMLINNSLSGTALALNAMIDYLHGSREQVEVLLTFGATPWEAAWPGFVKSVQAALIPAINGMNVVGLVSIPGMMTGQILGGASPMKAARYQIMICFLISGCTFFAVCAICAFTIQAFFDDRGRHDASEVREQSRLNIAKTLDLSRLWKKAPVAVAGEEKQEPLLSSASERPLRLELRCTYSQADAGGAVLLDVDMEGAVGKNRELHARLEAKAGQVVCIMGPSGVGKSTILKWISDLCACSGHRKMALKGTSSEEITPQAWRQSVLYVHQLKAALPGTPRSFIEAVENLRINRGRPALAVEPIMQAVGLDAELLERPWKELSGGEVQRTMCAIALSTEPACLLLDEPTSALDEASKQLVEQTILRRGGRMTCTLIVTHDAKQAERMGSSTWSIAE